MVSGHPLITPTPHLMVRSPSSEALQNCSTAFMRHQGRRLNTGGMAIQDAAVQAHVEQFIVASGGNVQEAASRASRLLMQSLCTTPCHYAFRRSITHAIKSRIEAIVPEFAALYDWINKQTTDLQLQSLADRIEVDLSEKLLQVRRVENLSQIRGAEEILQIVQQRVERGVEKMFDHLPETFVSSLTAASIFNASEIRLLCFIPGQEQIILGNERRRSHENLCA